LSAVIELRRAELNQPSREAVRSSHISEGMIEKTLIATAWEKYQLDDSRERKNITPKTLALESLATAFQ
jgi:hypothetical protein